MNLYNNKPVDYFCHARTEIEPLLHPAADNQRRVLEIGCAEGYTLEWLKVKGLFAWTAGVEPFADVNTKNRGIDHFEKLDIEEKLPDIPLRSLDTILCLDVLEHLRNPWEVVFRLSCLLKPGGQWIVSVPNIRNYRIVMGLFFLGNFRYEDSGIMDRSHLRFFTRETLQSMMESVGAHVESITDPERKRWQKRLLAYLGMGDVLAKQLLLSATQPSTHNP